MLPISPLVLTTVIIMQHQILTYNWRPSVCMFYRIHGEKNVCDLRNGLLEATRDLHYSTCMSQPSRIKITFCPIKATYTQPNVKIVTSEEKGLKSFASSFFFEKKLHFSTPKRLVAICQYFAKLKNDMCNHSCPPLCTKLCMCALFL